MPRFVCAFAAFALLTRAAFAEATVDLTEFVDGKVRIHLGNVKRALYYTILTATSLDAVEWTPCGAAEIFNDNGYGGTTAVSSSPSGKVSIPDTLGAWTVRSIGNNALCSCNNMTEVFIPECVTNIEEFAFAETPIIKVTIPDEDRRIRFRVLQGRSVPARSISATSSRR